MPDKNDKEKIKDLESKVASLKRKYDEIEKDYKNFKQQCLTRYFCTRPTEIKEPL